MDPKELAGLTEEELLQEKKKLNRNNSIHAFLIGAFIGIAIYSAVKNGLGFSTFFPLFFVYLLVKNGNKSKDINKELESRGK